MSLINEKVKAARFFAILLVEILVVSTIFASIPLVKKLSAANAYVYSPIPGTIDFPAYPEPVVPCLEEDLPGQPGSALVDPEFHSLRPYQASPCGDAPKAYFCNNDYTIIEDLTTQWDLNWCWTGSADGVTPGDSYFCELQPNATMVGPGGKTFSVYIIGGQDGRDYAVSLNRVKYPFMGNTQDVFNSQSNVETLDAAGKMNEHVNWYLQGASEKAEYGLKGTQSYPVYPNNVATYAGPAKKLLPFDILNHQRLKVLHDAGVKPPQGVDIEEYQGDITLLTPVPETGGYETRQTLNHNHIAVCSAGGGIPIPCYAGNGSKAIGSERRLVQWWEARGSTPSQTFFGWTITNTWGGVTPPFPWQFIDPYLYRKAFLEWTGQKCIVIPLSDRYMCFSTYVDTCTIAVPIMCSAITNTPGLSLASPACTTGLIRGACQAALVGAVNVAQNAGPICLDIINRINLNSMSDLLTPVCTSALVSVSALANGFGGASEFVKLYDFIPLGNANDKNARHVVGGVQVRPAGQTEARLIDYDITNHPVLHYAHTESTVQVSKLLNQINTPLECTTNPEGTTPAPIPGEFTLCCAPGFTYSTTGADMCVNNEVFNNCQATAAGICDAINGIANSNICNPYPIAQFCQSQVIGGEIFTQSAAVMCTTIVNSIPGLNILASTGISLCTPIMQTVINYFEARKETLLAEPLCDDGLVCTHPQGVCRQPAGPLSCEKIKGQGSNYEPTSCTFTDVRINPGDSLTFKDPHSYFLVEDTRILVEYIECSNKGELNRFHADPPEGCGGITWNICQTDACKVGKNGCLTCPPTGGIPAFCTSWPDCNAEVEVKIPTWPKIPFADQIWKQTVIDKNTSFRRIFPKFGEGTPVQCIKEIPGTSPVTYIPNHETNLVKVETAGPNVYGPSNGQLFFPHLGTIYEYFLKGIQTALRPKGFGYGPLPQGDPARCITSEICSEETAVATKAVPECILKGVTLVETGGGTNMGEEGCATNHGTFSCCESGVCGPAQISCSQYNAFAGNDNLDMCDTCGAYELLARAMLLKLCQADGKCGGGSYDWEQWGEYALQHYGNLEEDQYKVAACYFYGLQNGCYPSACSQYRWGAGVNYGDAVMAMGCGGAALEGGPFPEFCADCAEEDPRVQCNQ